VKPDEEPKTDMEKIKAKMRFNSIDAKLKVKDLMYFKVDVKQREFLQGFCKEFGFNMSEAGRFCIDITRAMHNGGMLEEFVKQFSEFKKRDK